MSEDYMGRDYPLNKIILPMGATSVKDKKKMEDVWNSPEYVAEEKYDGSRYLSISGRFFSRRVSVVDNLPVEKTSNVPHLNKILSQLGHAILDGEVYIEGGTSNEVTSIMGSKPERALQLQTERGFLRYVLYDILRDVDGNWLIDLPWIERRKKLEEVFEQISELDEDSHIFLTSYVKDNKKEYCNNIILNGGEGVVLKNINGKYHLGKRPRWNWIKVKQEITADVVITGFKEPEHLYTGKEIDIWEYWEDKHGELLNCRPHEDTEYLLTEGYKPVTKFYYMGWIGSIEFSQYNENGELVYMGECSGITDQLRKDMSENPDKYIGEVMEITAMQMTKDGYFRHPQFSRLRDDKNPEECVKGVL